LKKYINGVNVYYKNSVHINDGRSSIIYRDIPLIKAAIMPVQRSSRTIESFDLSLGGRHVLAKFGTS
jgi:hypothetical protein